MGHNHTGWPGGVHPRNASEPPPNQLRSGAACDVFTVPHGSIWLAPNGGNYTEVWLRATSFFIANCTAEQLPPIFARLDELSRELDNSTYRFSASHVPLLAAAAACFIMSWILLVVLFVPRSPRPLLLRLTALYVAVYFTVQFATLQHHARRQHNNGYNFSTPWAHEYYATPRIVAFFLCFSGLAAAETQVLHAFFRGPAARRLVLSIGAVLAAAQHALWIAAIARGCVTDDKFELPPLMRSWLAVIQAAQLWFAATLGWRFCRKASLAFRWAHAGVATWTVLAVCGSFIAVAAVQCATQIWIWALSIFVVTRILLLMFVWTWKVAIDELERECVKRGTMGRQIFDKREVAAYDAHLSGRGFGTTTAPPANGVAALLRHLRSWTPSAGGRGMPVTALETTLVEPDAASVASHASDTYASRPRAVVNHGIVRRRVETPTPAPTLSLAGRAPDEISVSLSEASVDTHAPAGSAGASPAGPSTLGSASTAAAPATAAPATAVLATDAAPPPFRPHAGFRTGDYWDEKSHRHF